MTLDHFTATVMAVNLARQIHQKFLKQKEQSTTHTQNTVPLTKNELMDSSIYVDVLLKI